MPEDAVHELGTGNASTWPGGVADGVNPIQTGSLRPIDGPWMARAPARSRRMPSRSSQVVPSMAGHAIMRRKLHQYASPVFDMSLSLKLFLLLAVVALSPVVSADVLERIRERDRLMVAVKNEGHPDRAAHKDPAHFQKRDYELALAAAIAERLLGDAGKLQIKTLRKPERLPAVVDGRVDIGLSMFRITPEHAALVDFSIPYYGAATAVMQRAEGGIREPGDLAGRRIGIIARNDAGPEPLLEQSADGQGPAHVLGFASFGDAAAAIERGEIDGLMSDAVNIDVYLAGHAGTLARSPVLSRAAIGVAVPKGNPAMLREIDALLDEFARTGTLARLQREHGLPATAPAP